MDVPAPPHPAVPHPPAPARAPAPPALLRSARRDLLVLAAGVLLPVLVAGQVAGLGPTHALIALLWCAVGAGLVWQGLLSGAHPHARFGGANRITALRLVLAGVLAGLLGAEAWAAPLAAETPVPLAWGVVMLAMATALLDACDGPLARRSGLASDFGARFDMESDAAFTLVLCTLVWQAGQAGPWVLAAGLMRYAFVGAARGWPWLAAPLAPSRRRQTVCVLQISALIVCLMPIVPPALSTAMAAASLALLGLSFAIDIRTLAQTPSSPPPT